MPDANITELLAFEQLRQQALTRPDLILLDTLLAEDLIHIHSTGMVHNKQQLLQHVERMGGFVAISRPPPAIHLLGDMAMMTGPVRNRIRLLESGEEKERAGFSTLLLRQTPQGWQIVLSQLTPYQT